MANPDVRLGKINFFNTPKIDLGIPKSVATIENVFVGAARWAARAPQRGAPTIYLIQDAHSNESAQLNIAKIIDRILEKESVRTVFVEAGTGNDSISFLRRHGTPERRESVARKYLRKGFIQGPDYLDLTSDRKFSIWGVENKPLYWKSLECYRSLRDNRESLNAYLDKIDRAIKTLKREIYRPRLARFDAEREDFSKNRLSTVDYFEALSRNAAERQISMAGFPQVARLAALRQKELGIDFDKAAREEITALQSLGSEDRPVKPFRLAASGQEDEKGFHALLEEKLRTQGLADIYPELLKYFDYLKAAAVLDAESLLAERESLENAIYAAILQSDDEKRLYTVSHGAEVLRKLLNLQLTVSEFTEIERNPSAFDIVAIGGFLNEKIMEIRRHYEDAIFLDPGYDKGFKNATEFYRLTRRRDEAFVKNIFLKMDATGERKAILVTGGYHTENLEALLRRLSVSYVVIRPQVLEETNTQKYENILLGNPSIHAVNTLPAKELMVGSQRVIALLSREYRVPGAATGARAAANSGDFVEPSLIKPDSALGILADNAGIRLYAPESAKKAGFWKYKIVFDSDAQRDIFHEKIMPAYKVLLAEEGPRKIKNWPLVISIVFKNEKPVVIMSEGIAWNQLTPDEQRETKDHLIAAIIKSYPGSDKRSMESRILAEKGLEEKLEKPFKVGYAAFPIVGERPADLKEFREAVSWVEATHPNTIGVFSWDLFRDKMPVPKSKPPVKTHQRKARRKTLVAGYGYGSPCGLTFMYANHYFKILTEISLPNFLARMESEERMSRGYLRYIQVKAPTQPEINFRIDLGGFLPRNAEKTVLKPGDSVTVRYYLETFIGRLIPGFFPRPIKSQNQDQKKSVGTRLAPSPGSSVVASDAIQNNHAVYIQAVAARLAQYSSLWMPNAPLSVERAISDEDIPIAGKRLKEAGVDSLSVPFMNYPEIDRMMFRLVGLPIRYWFHELQTLPEKSFKAFLMADVLRHYHEAAPEKRRKIRYLIAESTGNQGRAVADVVKKLKKLYPNDTEDLTARLYVPIGASHTKIKVMQELGAEVIQQDSEGKPISDYAHASLCVEHLQKEAGDSVYYIRHGSKNGIAGYATIGLGAIRQWIVKTNSKLATELPSDFMEFTNLLRTNTSIANALDRMSFVFPVGSGGLGSGIAQVARWCNSAVFGVSPLGVAPLHDQLFDRLNPHYLTKEEHRYPFHKKALRFTDGVAATPEKLTFDIFYQMVSGLGLVDYEINNLMVYLLWNKLNPLGVEIEPSSVLPLTFMLFYGQRLFGNIKDVIIPVTGATTDQAVKNAIIKQGKRVGSEQKMHWRLQAQMEKSAARAAGKETSSKRQSWENPDKAKEAFFRVLDSIPGFSQAKEDYFKNRSGRTKDAKRKTERALQQMAYLYWKHVVLYGSENESSAKRGAREFFTARGLSGLLSGFHLYLVSGSVRDLMKFTFPELHEYFVLKHISLRFIDYVLEGRKTERFWATEKAFESPSSAMAGSRASIDDYALSLHEIPPPNEFNKDAIIAENKTWLETKKLFFEWLNPIRDEQYPLVFIVSGANSSRDTGAFAYRPEIMQDWETLENVLSFIYKFQNLSDKNVVMADAGINALSPPLSNPVPCRVVLIEFSERAAARLANSSVSPKNASGRGPVMKPMSLGERAAHERTDLNLVAIAKIVKKWNVTGVDVDGKSVSAQAVQEGLQRIRNWNWAGSTDELGRPFGLTADARYRMIAVESQGKIHLMINRKKGDTILNSSRKGNGGRIQYRVPNSLAGARAAEETQRVAVGRSPAKELNALPLIPVPMEYRLKKVARRLAVLGVPALTVLVISRFWDTHVHPLAFAPPTALVIGAAAMLFIAILSVEWASRRPERRNNSQVAPISRDASAARLAAPNKSARERVSSTRVLKLPDLAQGINRAYGRNFESPEALADFIGLRVADLTTLSPEDFDQIFGNQLHPISLTDNQQPNGQDRGFWDLDTRLLFGVPFIYQVSFESAAYGQGAFLCLRMDSKRSKVIPGESIKLVYDLSVEGPKIAKDSPIARVSLHYDLNTGRFQDSLMPRALPVSPEAHQPLMKALNKAVDVLKKRRVKYLGDDGARLAEKSRYPSPRAAYERADLNLVAIAKIVKKWNVTGVDVDGKSVSAQAVQEGLQRIRNWNWAGSTDELGRPFGLTADARYRMIAVESQGNILLKISRKSGDTILNSPRKENERRIQYRVPGVVTGARLAASLQNEVRGLRQLQKVGDGDLRRFQNPFESPAVNLPVIRNNENPAIFGIVELYVTASLSNLLVAGALQCGYDFAAGQKRRFGHSIGRELEPDGASWSVVFSGRAPNPNTGKWPRGYFLELRPWFSLAYGNPAKWEPTQRSNRPHLSPIQSSISPNDTSKTRLFPDNSKYNISPQEGLSKVGARAASGGEREEARGERKRKGREDKRNGAEENATALREPKGMASFRGAIRFSQPAAPGLGLSSGKHSRRKREESQEGIPTVSFHSPWLSLRDRHFKQALGKSKIFDQRPSGTTSQSLQRSLSYAHGIDPFHSATFLTPSHLFPLTSYLHNGARAAEVSGHPEEAGLSAGAVSNPKQWEFLPDPWDSYKTLIHGDPDQSDGNTPSLTQDTLGCATLVLNQGFSAEDSQRISGYPSDDDMFNRMMESGARLAEEDGDTILNSPQKENERRIQYRVPKKPANFLAQFTAFLLGISLAFGAEARQVPMSGRVYEVKRVGQQLTAKERFGETVVSVDVSKRNIIDNRVTASETNQISMQDLRLSVAETEAKVHEALGGIEISTVQPLVVEVNLDLMAGEAFEANWPQLLMACADARKANYGQNVFFVLSGSEAALRQAWADPRTEKIFMKELSGEWAGAKRVLIYPAKQGGQVADVHLPTQLAAGDIFSFKALVELAIYAGRILKIEERFATAYAYLAGERPDNETLDAILDDRADIPTKIRFALKALKHVSLQQAIQFARLMEKMGQFA